jgi:hypothetical protein
MDGVLKDVVVPRIRDMGFRGSLPHFRRIRGDALDLLSVQHFSSGGSLVIELGKAPAEGIMYGSRHIPADKLNTTYPVERMRLGSDPTGGRSDHWFVYGRRSYESTLPAPTRGQMEAVASEIVALLESQAEPWWRAS